MLPELPTLFCPVREIGPVEANVQAPGWQQIEPVWLVDVVTGAAPKQATQLRVAASGPDLRVLFDCVDSEPWGTMTKRNDPIYDEEVVEVFLDPVGDLECYFEIELSPLNTVLDLVIRKSVSGLKKDFDWGCEGLRTAVQRTEQGWAGELAIPFASLMPGAGRMPAWRCNFTRIDRPGRVEQEFTAFSVTGLPLFHVPNRFGAMRIE